MFALYNTTQGTESHTYSAFHRHQREPLYTPACSAFLQTNKPAAFFFQIHVFFMERKAPHIFPIKYTVEMCILQIAVHHPTERWKPCYIIGTILLDFCFFNCCRMMSCSLFSLHYSLLYFLSRSFYFSAFYKTLKCVTDRLLSTQALQAVLRATLVCSLSYFMWLKG